MLALASIEPSTTAIQIRRRAHYDAAKVGFRELGDLRLGVKLPLPEPLSR
jgi:hypothetical protein